MSSHLVAIPGAVTDEINGGAFSMEFVAKRSYQTQFKLEDLGKLKVDVVPVSAIDTELIGAATLASRVGVNVLLRYRFKQVELNEDGTVIAERIDDYVNLYQEIYLHLVKKMLGEGSQYEIECPVAYSQAFLDENQQYLGMIHVGYHATDAIP